MSNETTAAIQALLKQVTALTETVEKQNTQIDDQNKRLDGLKDFNGRVLDEKKDLERKVKETPVNREPPTDEKLAEMDANGFELGADGNWYMKGSKHTLTLTRDEARDPQAYQAAKAAAAASGQTVRIVDANAIGDPTKRNSRTPTDTSTRTTVVKDEDRQVAYMRRDVMGSDTAQYKQLRQKGFVVHPWNKSDDLPQHMRTKLALMEKANESD